jgi:hypothetical protein
MRPRVSHQPDSFVISIPTTCPAAFHYDLAFAVSEAVKLVLSNPDKTGDNAAIIALITLQQLLIPLETQLEKAYQ